jgi:sRNA-binding carbon storage regulator CsrA
VQVHRREVYEAILREQSRIQADNELYKNIKDSDPKSVSFSYLCRQHILARNYAYSDQV